MSELARLARLAWPLKGIISLIDTVYWCCTEVMYKAKENPLPNLTLDLGVVQISIFPCLIFHANQTIDLVYL